MTVPVRAALYLRVSTARQAEHDVSIPDQKRRGEAWCASRGYELVETFVEPGAAATNDRRPEFQRMIEAGTIKPAPFDVVIVHSFSRFFRDAFDMEFYVRKLATKARQGRTGCKGRSIPMDRLDQLVAGHLEARLLRPERLETILASVLDRRQERAERRREHLAELHKRITEADQRLNRLFDAIESGANADAERAQAALDHVGNQAVSPDR